ncbi:MAG: NAD(P)/FAD-dependent oxidoreductase [Verrucomicrobiota bacterium]|nr:NAD(P)/FAD-dependent oxidoreductase [Verrucomicrobiota bacterium]
MAKVRSSGAELPDADALLSGADFRDRYLVPLARSFSSDVLHTNSAVHAIGRSRILKGDHIGDPARAGTSFRLLVSDEGGERIVSADVVLDCSGTYGQPNNLGDSGIPAPGEKAASHHIFYGIPNVAGADRSRFAGRRVLVVGAGHSAATAITNVATLETSDRSTQLHWLLRRDRELPVEEIADDPLAERARLASAANRLVHDGRVTLHRGAAVDSIQTGHEGLTVNLTSSAGSFVLALDEIIVATGFRPDMALARELQVQTCWATEGTYPLAASMLGEAGAECLKTPAFGAEMLMHPEPGYFTLGMKSYGRAPNFLLRTGHQQIETVLDWLGQNELDKSMRQTAA